MARKISRDERSLIESTITALQSPGRVPADARRVASQLLVELLNPPTKAGRTPRMYGQKLAENAQRHFNMRRARHHEGMSYDEALNDIAEKDALSGKAIEKSIAEFKRVFGGNQNLTPEQWQELFLQFDRMSLNPAEVGAAENVRMAAFEAVNYVNSERKSLEERVKEDGSAAFNLLVARCIEHCTVHMLNIEFPPERREYLRNQCRAIAIHYAKAMTENLDEIK